MKRKIVMYFLLFTCSGMTAEAVEVRLKAQANATGPLVLLGDVADIQSAEKSLKQKLQRIELFPSPASGQTRLARVQEIRELVELQGTDPGTVSWSGSPQVRVGATVRTAAPASERKTSSDPASSDSSVSDTAPASAAPAKLSKLAVVFARRNLARGEVIREADVELREVDAAPRDSQALNKTDDAVGQEVIRPVGSGELVDGRCLQRATLVKRGEAVTVCSRAQGVCVRTVAKAMEDGGRDDLIMLESLENKKRFSARIVGLQEAEVYAAGFHVPRIASTPAPPTPIVKK